MLTKFQRTHIRIGVAALALLAAAASVVRAQTFDDAVRANAALGLQLCLSGGRDFGAWAQSFRNAGFAERVEATGGDTTHWFTAPAQTVQVELYYGQMPEHCTVSSSHMGVTAANEILDQVVPRMYPGYVRQITVGPINPQTGQSAQCVRYEDPTNPIGQVIGVINQGNSGDCVEDGTSQFFSAYRV